MKCKPIVYFSGRHVLTPALTRAMQSLSHHVAIVGQIDVPEVAYTAIFDCDVFLCFLHPTFCENIFLMYELGVALILRKPIIIVRETGLKLSEIHIPKHFYKTRVLIPPNTGSFQTYSSFGKTYNLPLSLGDFLTCAYGNSMICCPYLETKFIAVLMDKIFRLSKRPALLKEPCKTLVLRKTFHYRKSEFDIFGYSIEAEPLAERKVSLVALRNDFDEKLKNNSEIDEHKLNELRSNIKASSVHQVSQISIEQLVRREDHTAHVLHSKNRFAPVTPDKLLMKDQYVPVLPRKSLMKSRSEPINPTLLPSKNKFEVISPNILDLKSRLEEPVTLDTSHSANRFERVIPDQTKSEIEFEQVYPDDPFSENMSTPVKPDASHSEIQVEPEIPTTLSSEIMFEPATPVLCKCTEKVQTLQGDTDEGLGTRDLSCDVTFLHDKNLITSANTTPLSSPIPSREVYYPAALPVYPMELSFPPFQIEKLYFDKHAVKIAKADKLPSIIRRRIIRKL